jgi:hypothetical protein
MSATENGPPMKRKAEGEGYIMKNPNDQYRALCVHKLSETGAGGE